MTVCVTCVLSATFVAFVSLSSTPTARAETVIASRFDESSDLSELKIFFKLANGKLKVNRIASKLNSTARFDSRLSRSLARDKVQNSLFDDVDRALAKNEKVYYYSLPDATRTRIRNDGSYREQLERAPATKAVAESNLQDWSRFENDFRQWHDTPPTGLSPTILASALLAELKNLPSSLTNTPLSIDVNGGVDVADDVDQSGQIIFHVADPIGTLEEDEYSIVVPTENGEFAHKDKITPKKADILKALAPLKGHLWRSNRIGSYLTRFFDDSDYQRTKGATMDLLPAFFVSEVDYKDEDGNQKKLIQIGKIRRIARVDLLGFAIDDPATSLVLRQLLDDSAFRTLVKKQYGPGPGERPIHLAPATNLLPFSYLYLDTVTGKGKEPHMSNPRFDAQSAALASLGYSLAVDTYDPEEHLLPGGGPGISDPEGDRLYLRLLVSKMVDEKAPGASPSASNGAGTPPAPPSPASSPSQPVPSRLDDSEATATPSPNPSPSPKPHRAAIKQKPNYLGAEFVFKPDQGVRFYGVYRRVPLLKTKDGTSDLTVKVGNRDEHFITTGDFVADNLFFRKIHRRLSVTLSGAADFEVRRVFAGVNTDERREFSSIRGELDVLTRPKQLSIFFAAKGGTVELLHNEVSISKQRLNLISFGGSTAFKTDEVAPLRSVQLDATMQFGLGLAANEPKFKNFSLRGIFQYHRDIPARYGVQIAGRVDLASRNTPIFEQPSFGGVDSVRGFRQDDAIGRLLWSLQNEVRGPVFGLAPDVQGWKAFIRNQVKLAAFLDLGAVYETTGSKPGLRAGPGLGMRVNFQGVNMKFDFAYGLGDGARGNGRGRFHFSVETPLRF
jgi:hypothetical protein